MNVREVLAMFPELPRSTLEFWEREGHIAPRKVLLRKHYGRREYSDEDIEKIKLLREARHRTTHYEGLAERVRRIESIVLDKPRADSGDRFADYLGMATQEKYM